MVKATLGVLVEGDVALIEFVRALDEQQPPADKFIINGALGDRCLLIKERFEKFVRDKVAEWQQSLRFEPKPGQQ